MPDLTSSLSGSAWPATFSFFPLYLDVLRWHPSASAGPHLVVGAADGKFVIPLALLGHEVLAVEHDRRLIDGDHPELVAAGRNGLTARIAAANVGHRVQTVIGDIRDAEVPKATYASTYTSCSWHYSLNADRPVADFVQALCDPLMVGGLLAAEYMMPTEDWHLETDRYLGPGHLKKLLASDWSVLFEAYSEPFAEAPHLGQPGSHQHRLGFILAERRG